MKKCQFPECGKASTGTFALVNLCELHYDTIWTETRKYYRSSGGASNYDARRPQYLKIAPLIPWSRKT